MPRRLSPAPGLPAVARAAARVLEASVALIDRSSAVLAVAGASPDQERRLLAGGEGVVSVDLRVADSPVGELRYRSKAGRTRRSPAWWRRCSPSSSSAHARPEWESEEAAAGFVHAVLSREVTDRGDISPAPPSSAPTSSRGREC